MVAFLGDDVSHESPTTSFRNLHMEYLPGGTAADDPTGTRDDKLLRERTWCLVSALSYIHSKGIVHCDVKGRNVLIGLNPGFLKLADFGSAIELHGPGHRSRDSLAPRGSPLWMAPEVVRGEFQGPESDVWSLGCTVIEMVTGKPAWEDFGADTLSRIGFSDDLPDFPTCLSEVCRDFLRKCLRRNPSERWSCDRLLQHPFLAAAAAASPKIAVENSPRCVLDWVNVSFSDDEEEIPHADEASGSGGQENEIYGKERIGKLSTTSDWPNWESDGWSAVRSSYSEAAAETEASCRKEEEEEEGGGAEWECGNLRRVEGEMEGRSWEYSEFVRRDNHGKLGAEYSNPGGMIIPERPRNNFGGGGGCGSGGLSFRRLGYEISEITTIITSWIYSIELILCCYYWNILMKKLVLFGNYTFLPFFSA